MKTIFKKASFYALLFALLLGSQSCGFKSKDEVVSQKNKFTNSIEAIKHSGKLKVAISYSPTGFFVYKGTPMGFHYDMAERLAKHLGVSLDLVITKNEQEQLAKLKNREVDIIAESFTNTHSANEFVEYVVHFKSTNLVLVQRKPENWPKQKPTINKLEQLAGKNIHLAQLSSHRNCIKSISNKLNMDVFVWDVDEKITQYQLVEEVSEKAIDYAIVAENVGRLMQSHFQNIDISLKLNNKEKFGWITHVDATAFTKYIDDWVVDQKDNNNMYVLYNKYYKNHYAFNKRVESEYLSHETGKISKFDDLIKKHAELNDIDWRLLAALIQQESRFNPVAVSWAGAKGLMQLMPATAKQYGFKNLTDPELNIKAGIKHFSWLRNYWEDKIEDKDQKLKFILASYNVGHGHVSDAMKLAEKYGKSPIIWDDNVDIFIRKKSNPDYYKDPVVKYGYCRGSEPYFYVINITNRYKHYRQIIELDKQIAYAAYN